MVGPLSFRDVESPSNTAYWVSFAGGELQLQQGETILGRSDSCQIVLEGALVSRRHAVLYRNGDEVEIEDLGSVNGVLVDGRKIAGRTRLRVGALITLGSQQISITRARGSRRERRGAPSTAVTLTGERSPLLDSHETAPERSNADTGDFEATRRGDLLDMLGGVADKVLNMGRGEEAERVLSNFLRGILERAKMGRSLDDGLVDRVGMYAARIAQATKKSQWVNFTFELYQAETRVMPPELVDKLYVIVRGIAGVDVPLLADYVAALRQKESAMTPGERFLLRRLDGLEELARHSGNPQPLG